MQSIHERDKLTPDIKNTLDFGHFEGDTIVSKDHKSISIAWSIINFILKLPQATIKTITFDGGKEFSKWKLIEKACDIKIYFADSGTPCQRGLNEKNNGILRRYFSKSTDLLVDTQKQLDEWSSINNQFNT